MVYYDNYIFVALVISSQYVITEFTKVIADILE